MKCIYHAYISHVSRYSLDQKKVSSRSHLGHSRFSSRSRLGLVSVSSRSRLGLVSVSSRAVWQTSRSRLGSSGLSLGLCLDPEGLGPIPGYKCLVQDQAGIRKKETKHQKLYNKTRGVDRGSGRGKPPRSPGWKGRQ